jgi:ribosomal protein S12 methylthiotransferase accessory factor
VRRPIPRSGLTFESLGAATVLLRSDVEAHWLHGSAYPLLLPLLDGRTADDVVAALDGTIEPEAVHYALTVLQQRGLIQEHDPTSRASRAAFWGKLGADPAVAAARLAEAGVEIRSLEGGGDASIDALSAAIREWGVRAEAGGSLLVVVSLDYRDSAIAEINREQLAAGRPWMLVNAASRTALTGPVFRPGSSACWACLEHRLQENRLTAPIADHDSPMRPNALHFAATELIKWIGLAGSPLDGGILTFDAATLTAGRHVVHRRPQCGVCGDPETATSFGAIVLQSQQKASTIDGGYRTRSAEATAAILEEHVSPISGIMPGVWRVSHEGPAVFSTRINGPLGSVFHQEALAGRPLSAAGKGMSPAQSRAGCLAEAVERYSACFQGHEPRLTATAAALGPDAVGLEHLLCFSDAQYREREKSNRRQNRQYEVPEPSSPDTVLDWIPSWSIAANAARYLPAAYCFIDYPSPDGKRFCVGDSNGCAAGNTIEEAILQGFLELVERDALAIWWHNRVPRPARDIAGFDDPSLAASAAHMRALGRTLHVFNITHDLAVPVFAAVSATLAGDEVRIGSGAHLDPRLALTRAVSEVHQSLAWPRERTSPGLTLATVPHLRPDQDWQGCPAWPTSTDLRDDVLRCVELARRRGLDVIVTNLTRPDLAFPVVRVTVPGLRHYRPRFGPGRLYHVPVEMGWLAQPLTEAELLLEPLVL